MSLPTLSGTAKIIEEIDFKFGQNGSAITKIRLAFNSRKQQDDGTWANDRSFYITGVMFKQAAENAAEAFSRMDEVVVTGRLCTDEWNDKTDGKKRSTPSLLIDSIGPAINQFQTAKVSKLERSSGGGQSSSRNTNTASEPPADDPWATAQAGAPSGGGFEENPPF